MSLASSNHPAANGSAAAPCAVVNGRTYPLGELDPHLNVLDWLREQGLTGAKEGCAEGECGACAVMVARESVNGGTQWTALNSCLVSMAAMDGQELVTAEGIGRPGALHPVQQAMCETAGSQCGYCTPGFVCSMAAEFYRDGREPAAETAEHGPNGFDLHALSGNLCRCTGYRPIRDAAWALPQPEPGDPLFERRATPAPQPAPTRMGDRYVRPRNLGEALELLAAHPDAKLVAGSTDWGVEVNLRHSRSERQIAIDRLPELTTVETRADSIEIGAAVALTDIERHLQGAVPLLDQLMPQFASRLIRNGATLGGNLGTGSPIGDSPPALLALDAALVLASTSGERRVPLSEYFTGYRASVRRPDEIIKTISIPLPVAPITAFHKIAKRRFDDISSVAVAYALRLRDGLVAEIRIGVGGAAATPLRATAAEQALTGGPWTAPAIDAAAEILGAEGTPLSDHRASAAYRATMLAQSLRKFFAEAAEEATS